MRTATRLVFPVVLGLLLAFSAASGTDALAAGGKTTAGKSNLSQKRYTGARRLSKAANGAGASFMSRDQGLVDALGGKPITSRRVKVTKLATTTSATSTNHRYRVETVKKIGGVAAASTEVTVADFAVKGPRGGRAREARFFQRKDTRVSKSPALAPSKPSRRSAD